MLHLVNQVERLWSDSDQPQDIVSWWSSTADGQNVSVPTELFSALLLDQWRRWQTAQPWTVEKYLSEPAPLPPGIDWRLKLANGQLAARQKSAYPMTAHQIRLRFPDVAERIAASSLQASPGQYVTEFNTGTNWIGLSDRYRLNHVVGAGGIPPGW